MDLVQEEERDLKSLFRMFKKKKFEGNTGQAVKNSSYQISQTIVAKIGSLFFTIIIARMLMPDLFGLYSLALSTIVLFSSFSDLGIGSALITFISKKIAGGESKKAKAYFDLLVKYKIYLLIGTSLILMSSAYFISNFYYNKPIFFALLAGGLYIPINGAMGFLEGFFKAQNNFKLPLFKEIVFQIMRLISIPLLIFVLLNKISNPMLIFWIILGLAFCYFVVLIFYFYFSRKDPILKLKRKDLDSQEKKDLMKFVLPLSATALSGMFFGYIDIIMLGHFVLKNYLGYYGAANSLIGSASALLGFVGISLLPIFSRLTSKQLEKNFKKTRNFLLLLSIPGPIITFFLAPQIITLVYGSAYMNSILILKIFSILLLTAPLNALYATYFVSQERTLTIAKLLVFATILNVTLNYFFIVYGLKFGMIYALIGAAVATVISKLFYFFGMIWFRKK